MPFSKEGTILIKKNLYECKGYNARQLIKLIKLITEFPDKGWKKNSINGEVKKVRKNRYVNKAEWRRWRVGLIFVNFGDAI